MTLGKVAVGVQTLGAHFFSTDVFCVSCECQDSYGGDQNPNVTLNRHEPEDEQQAGDSVRIRVSA